MWYLPISRYSISPIKGILLLIDSRTVLMKTSVHRSYNTSKETALNSYRNLHTFRTKPSKTYFASNRPTYLKTRHTQEVFPNTYQQYDQDFKAGRKQIQAKHQIESMSRSLEHLSKRGDLLIPDNRKRRFKESYPSTNPISEEMVCRSKSREKMWTTERRNRDNGIYTKLILEWKH